MIILGLDFETGEDFNLGKEANFVTELGMVLWDTDAKQPIDMISMLVNHGKPLSKRASELTHISQEMIDKYGVTPQYAAQTMAYFASRAQLLVAHNADFDRYYYKRDMEAAGYPELANMHFVDTMKDVEYPKDCYDRSLMYIAAYHKIINFHGHRALPDVLTMLTILNMYDIQKVYENSLSPEVAIIAFVSQEENHLAKKHRFSWFPKDRADCPEEVRGWWAKICKQWELPAKTQDLDFKYEIRQITRN